MHLRIKGRALKHNPPSSTNRERNYRFAKRLSSDEPIGDVDRSYRQRGEMLFVL